MGDGIAGGQKGPSQTESPLARVLRMHVCCLHLQAAEPDDAARPGVHLKVDPAWGQGSFWYYALDDDMAVFSCELSRTAESNLACLTPDYFSIVLRRRTQMARQQPTDRAQAKPPATVTRYEHATVVGSAWKGQAFIAGPRERERLRTVGVILLPRALQRLSLRCQCDPLMLAGAIAALDGTKTVRGLPEALDDIERARPSAVDARAYYESKVTEAASLIVDWSLKAAGATHKSLSAVDRTALNRTRRHLADNLDRTVPTDELCAVACMSASKLTGLFKATEGVTPQEYARALRMEQACKLLARTDLPLSAIASQLGFRRQGSFSEAFKDRFRITPREYRNLASER